MKIPDNYPKPSPSTWSKCESECCNDKDCPCGKKCEEGESMCDKHQREEGSHYGPYPSRPKDSEAVRTVDELNKIGQDFWQEYMSMISMEAHPTTAAGRLHELWFDALRHERERKA